MQYLPSHHTLLANTVSCVHLIFFLTIANMVRDRNLSRQTLSMISCIAFLKSQRVYLFTKAELPNNTKTSNLLTTLSKSLDIVFTEILQNSSHVTLCDIIRLCWDTESLDVTSFWDSTSDGWWYITSKLYLRRRQGHSEISKRPDNPKCYI